MQRIIGVNTNGSYIYDSEQNNSATTLEQLTMERIYKIEQCDNGWILRDDDAIAYQVCQEKDSDKEHEKFKKMLGEWLYEDLKVFLDEHDTISAKLTITFEETEE